MEIELPRDLKVLPPPDYSEIDPRLLEEIHNSDADGQPSRPSASQQPLPPSSSNPPPPSPSPPPPSHAYPSSSSPSLAPNPSASATPHAPPPAAAATLAPPLNPSSVPHPFNHPASSQPSPSVSVTSSTSSMTALHQMNNQQVLPPPSYLAQGPSPFHDQPFIPQQLLLSNPILPIHQPGYLGSKGMNGNDTSIKGEVTWMMNILFFTVGGGILTSFVALGLSFLLSLLILPFQAVPYILQESYYIFPFGRKAIWETKKVTFKRSMAQIGWLPLFVVLALPHLIFGSFLCLTVIGLPLGLQHFALVKFFWNPFEAVILSRSLKGSNMYSKEYFLDPK